MILKIFFAIFAGVTLTFHAYADSASSTRVDDLLVSLAGRDDIVKAESLHSLGEENQNLKFIIKELTEFLASNQCDTEELKKLTTDTIQKLKDKKELAAPNYPVPTPPQYPMVRKPAIYLYSKTQTNVRLDLASDVSPKYVYPPFIGETRGWSVTVLPHGGIRDQAQKNYRYLFWEGELPSQPRFDDKEGFIVSADSLIEFFENILPKVGLNEEEKNDFIVYWYPELARYPLVYLNFITSEYARAYPMKISPAPDALLQIYMVYRPVDQEFSVQAQKFTPFIRSGLTVVEWGGASLE